MHTAFVIFSYNSCIQHSLYFHITHAYSIRYNGYNFLSKNVYNPYDVLLYLDKKEIRSYWYEIGTPSFLIKLIKEKEYNITELEGIKADEELLNKIDTEEIEIEALMFQTGYLTIKNSIQTEYGTLYELGFPRSTKSYMYLKEEYSYVIAVFSMFYSTGYDIIIEDNTSKGRIDLSVIVNKKVVYIMEFKVLNNKKEKGKSLKQIKEKEYYKKYLNYERIYLVGIEFDKSKKSIINFEYELIGGKNQ